MRFVPPKPIAKSFFAVVLLMSATLSDIRAEVITPVDVIATSEFGAVEFLGTFSDVFATDLIDGGGLIDVEDTPDFVLDDLHEYGGLRAFATRILVIRIWMANSIAPISLG